MPTAAIRRGVALSVAMLVLTTGCTSSASHPVGHAVSQPASQPAGQPAPSLSLGPALSETAGHVVVVMMENHSYSEIIGNSSAPFLNSLAQQGMSLTEMHGVAHPSQPNYVALFSGGPQGITSDSCPHSFSVDNLGNQLRATGLGWSFAGYSEDLPSVGSEVCTAGSYARKHVPWTNFTDLPATVNQPWTSFPTSYSRLPTVAFVIPNLDDDMHNGTIAQGDAWVRDHFSGYATWARTHNSLLIITWDEDDNTPSNHIPTIITGANVPAKQVGLTTNTYSLLRLIEERYGLALLGHAASATQITGIAP
jgi:acid phosphatase